MPNNTPANDNRVERAREFYGDRHNYFMGDKAIIIKMLADFTSALTARLEAVEKERDAALADVKKFRDSTESLVASFDDRPEGEPDWITTETRNCALICAMEDLGWTEQAERRRETVRLKERWRRFRMNTEQVIEATCRGCGKKGESGKDIFYWEAQGLDHVGCANCLIKWGKSLVSELESVKVANRYALATFRALDQYTFQDSDHGLLIAAAVAKLEALADKGDNNDE